MNEDFTMTTSTEMMTMSTEMMTTLFEGFLGGFYVVSPNRTSFERIEDVPNFYLRSAPHFLILFFMEQLYLKLKKRPSARMNDAIVSFSHGMFMEINSVLFYGWRLLLYSYIYSNWRFVTLPWNSLWTWWICFISVDFLYYWTHRACHEINFLWAAHQVHHSSEEYNLTTSFRQSAFLNFFQWVFYLPMALAVPPSVYLVHLYFNLIYQFWIHTEAVKQLYGPLEYILNTASHHRVHHGRNKYCIDKNYAGVLIIWDRMFGTFQAEHEEVVYGLTQPINSFDLFHVELCHFKHMWKMFREMKGWKNKLSVLVKGPGWSPGKPWLGNLEDVPEIEYPIKKYDPQLSQWEKAYALWHFSSLLVIFFLLYVNHKVLPVLITYEAVAYVIISLTSIGAFLEKRGCSSWMELLRCILYFALERHFISHAKIVTFAPLTFFRLTYALSAFFWVTHFISNVKIRWNVANKKID